MKLHWGPLSPFVRKVMVVAHETGLADRIEKIRSVVAMTAPNHALMRDNPLSKIPTLITDDGMVLFDSLVICEYLDSVHAGPKLFPVDAAGRWQALRWHALGNGMLDAGILWRNERLRPEIKQSREILSAFDAKTRAALDLLDEEAEALSSARLTIGHVAIGCALGYLDFRFPELAWRSGRKHIANWFEPFSERPSMRLTKPAESPRAPGSGIPVDDPGSR
jgi:glutathione S-transferase